MTIHLIRTQQRQSDKYFSSLEQANFFLIQAVQPFKIIGLNFDISTWIHYVFTTNNSGTATLYVRWKSNFYQRINWKYQAQGPT